MFIIFKKIIEFGIKSKKLQYFGCDTYGNKYYINRKTGGRICIYYGTSEPSKIPPEWHSWMHGLSDKPLELLDFPWAKKYTPNTTGTDVAYKPSGSFAGIMQGDEACVKTVYTPWKP